MSETSDVTRPAIEAINAIPWCFAFRVQSGKVAVRGGWMHLAPEGCPDIAAVIKGTALFLETKTATGRIADEQKKRHEQLRRAGARVEVVRSVAEVMTVVRQVLASKGAV